MSMLGFTFITDSKLSMYREKAIKSETLAKEVEEMQDMAFIYEKRIEEKNKEISNLKSDIASKDKEILSVGKDLSVAKEEIERIHASGKDVWVIGGRSLYLTLLSHNLFTDIVHCVINYNGPGDCFAYKDRYQFESTLGCKMVSGIKLYSQSQIMEPKVEPFLNCQALERFHYTKVLDNKLSISLA